MLLPAQAALSPVSLHLVRNVFPSVVTASLFMERNSVTIIIVEVEMDVLHHAWLKMDGDVLVSLLPVRKYLVDLHVEMELFREQRAVTIIIQPVETDVRVHAKLKMDGNVQEFPHLAVLFQQPPKTED